MHVSALIKDYLFAIMRDDKDGVRQCQSFLNDPIPTVANCIEGDANDFHNASVDLTRKQEFSFAYRLLEVGTHKFPTDTDLLGDLLLYGLKCRSYTELEKYSDALLKLPKNVWTWRAFHFSIEYLMEGYEQADDTSRAVLEKKILGLLDDYKEHSKFFTDQSDREKAYSLKHRFYMIKRDIPSALKTLQDAIDEIPGKCPQCALRLADYYFDAGEYDKVIAPAECASLIIEVQPAISYSYLHFILGASREYILRKSSKLLSEENVRPIYHSYYAALVYAEDNDRKRHHNIKNRIRVLEYDSGIPSNIDFSQFDD